MIVYNETSHDFKTSRFKQIEKLAKKYKLKIDDIILIITNDKKIKFLNTLYRNKHYATDVLSFKYDLGTPSEIFISYDQIKRQAKLYHHSVQKEIEIMLAHGILHVAGYDHKTNIEREQMDKLLNKIIFI